MTIPARQQLHMLAQMGITWYVPSDYTNAAFNAEPVVALADQPAQATPIDTIALGDVIDAIAADLDIAATPATAASKALPTSTDTSMAVEPFHWLIAGAGFVNFVCDIKQARLAPVWHAAAQELLGDIAIAMGAGEAINSRYFSWPPSGSTNSLSDNDLPDFLAEFLASEGPQAVFVLMGPSAQQHASSLVLKGATTVASATLGQLFKDVQQKKALWQQLKPLRKS